MLASCVGSRQSDMRLSANSRYVCSSFFSRKNVICWSDLSRCTLISDMMNEPSSASRTLSRTSCSDSVKFSAKWMNPTILPFRASRYASSKFLDSSAFIRRLVVKLTSCLMVSVIGFRFSPNRPPPSADFFSVVAVASAGMAFLMSGAAVTARNVCVWCVLRSASSEGPCLWQRLRNASSSEVQEKRSSMLFGVSSASSMPFRIRPICNGEIKRWFVNAHTTPSGSTYASCLLRLLNVVLPNLLTQQRIQADGRFVQDEQLWLVNHGRGKRHPSLLSTATVADKWSHSYPSEPFKPVPGSTLAAFGLLARWQEKGILESKHNVMF
uniref:Uncharacterized protein n=1 Tax=Anopheles atroparvus TaxID=41427 RepID=A0A182J7U8_ANOAO